MHLALFCLWESSLIISFVGRRNWDKQRTIIVEDSLGREQVDWSFGYLFQSPSLDGGVTLLEPGVRYRHPFALCWATRGRKSQGPFGVFAPS